MKRGTKCIAQTINLSNPKTCVRPKVQKLVNADADSCSDPNDRQTTDYWTARPVAVKVCSRKNMQSKCPPKICTTTCLKKPVSNGERSRGIATFLLKGTIAAGLIYWTCAEGLWGDSTQTEDLYYRMISTFSPYNDHPAEPPLEGIRHSMSETYNRALVKYMDIIVGAMLEMHRKLRDILFPCDVTGEGEEAHAKNISDENSAHI
ncbi:uncharacterized protein LOC126858080 [Cataglyphis hispanica]|uniref:uncharacterized protein LOC126858080 n=1 Tax=Cataglyphis hispanica TaxID=1086592 RepID=UPI00217F3F61|nr:uncharacterized protein LOC126858080 [Cataglyphis hispanica]